MIGQGSSLENIRGKPGKAGERPSVSRFNTGELIAFAMRANKDSRHRVPPVEVHDGMGRPVYRL